MIFLGSGESPSTWLVAALCLPSRRSGGCALEGGPGTGLVARLASGRAGAAEERLAESAAGCRRLVPQSLLSALPRALLPGKVTSVVVVLRPLALLSSSAGLPLRTPAPVADAWVSLVLVCAPAWRKRAGRSPKGSRTTCADHARGAGGCKTQSSAARFRDRARKLSIPSRLLTFRSCRSVRRQRGNGRWQRRRGTS